MRNLIIKLLTLTAMLGTLQAELFYVNYKSQLDVTELQKYRVSIISPEADLTRINMNQPGKKIFGYLSIGEIAPDASYVNDAMRMGFDMQYKNQTWGSHLMDVSDPRWQNYIVDNLARQISSKGFQGFFLDTVDSHQILARGSESRKKSLEDGIVTIVNRLNERYPNMDILLNRGFDVWQRVAGSIDGVLAESLFHTYDFATGKYGPTSKGDQEWLLGKLKSIQQGGVPIYVIDYALPEQRDSIQRLYERYEGLGFNLCVSNVELDGQLTQPKSDEQRYVFTIYGRKSSNPEETIYWSVDSAVAATLQMPGEYLGLEFFYHNINNEGVPNPLTSRFKAIVVDNNMEIPTSMEQDILDWLIKEKNNGKKIIIWGKPPFTLGSVRTQFMREFGFIGSGDFIPITSKIDIAYQGSDFNFESKSIPSISDFMDLRAPLGSEKSLVLRSTGEDGNPIEFHPAFYADWGAFVYINEAVFRIGEEMHSWCLNPFLFLSKSLDIPNWPVPDVTTQNGLRLFYSHIDGDGFRNLSTISPGMRSSQAIYEKIIKKYPYPYTCSIIESEIRAQIEGQDANEEQDLIAIAREIFSNPKVEAASHTYSHPFYWKAEDGITGGYESQILPLKPMAGYNGIDIQKEIHNPIRFIEDFLLPEGKKVEIVLWSGNCRIPADALKMTKTMGVKNMNGGQTIISRNNPSLLRVAPKCRETYGELQIHNAVQNENVFRKSWKKNGVIPSTYYAGFENVLQTFKYTEMPRRLKPINVYYHWYSGDNWASVKALETVMDWCMKQRLSPVTASEYADIVEDSRETRIYMQSPETWVVTNGGKCRTFRFEDGNMVPDLHKSENVTGYSFINGKLYVATGLNTNSKIVLTQNPRQHAYVENATGYFKVTDHQQNRLVFTVNNFTNNHVKTAGWAPAQPLTIRVNSDEFTKNAGADGSFQMTLPENATVSIQQ